MRSCPRAAKKPQRPCRSRCRRAFCRQPVGVAEGVNGDFRQGRQTAETAQVLREGLGFGGQLARVADVLPLAAAAVPERGAEGLRPFGRRLQKLLQASFGETATVLGQADPRHVAGTGVGDENDLPVKASDRRSALGQAREFDRPARVFGLALLRHLARDFTRA